ncbi:alpha beta hydrolase fold-3 domain protein [Botrytis cinerea]
MSGYLLHQTYAPQAEIQQYFEGFALKYQLDKSTTFNTEIVSATWDDSRLLCLSSAAGVFGMPKKADIAGLKTFKGEQWHLGTVIGTGQSAGQAIPSIYPEVKQLTVYQRSPGHCLPRNDVSISGSRNYRWFGMAQFGFVAKRIFHIGSWWQKFVVGMAKNHLYNQISDDNLRRKLESKSHFGCKRPLKLDTWYPIFTNNNVDLVTDPVTGLTEDGILSREAEGGREIERKMDVLIWDTGKLSVLCFERQDTTQNCWYEKDTEDVGPILQW